MASDVHDRPNPVEQAKEIIRRTESFILGGHGGNDHAWNKKTADKLRLPHFWDIHDNAKKNWKKMDAMTEAFHKAWGSVNPYGEYIHNSWASSAFIGGPHGWCHPDGKIGFVDNVGKWPSIEDIAKEWEVIAQAFPFIVVGVTLMDAEGCENGTPVVSMHIQNGEVALLDPHESSVHEGHPSPSDRTLNMEANILKLVYQLNAREHGLPKAWFDEWAVLAAKLEPQWISAE